MHNKSKINSRSQHLYKHFDEDFVNVKFKPEVQNKIMKYQVIHVLNLISMLKKDNEICCVDFSLTGTGKTYTSLAVCSQMELNPIIICPKSAICYWKEICDFFCVIPKTIINYESIKNGKELTDELKKKKSDIIEIKYDEEDSDGEEKKKERYIWKKESIDKNKNIIIFDEAHRCKNHKTQNGKLLMSAKGVCRILLLSATISQKYEDFKIFGYMLGFYKRIADGSKWIKNLLREEKFRFKHDGETMLTKKLYPTKGSRMSYSDMDQYVKQNHVSTQCYTLDQKDIIAIENYYDTLEKYDEGHLAKQIHTRQKIEEIKLKIIIDLAEKYLDQGLSVVIFVNYLESLNILKKYLDKHRIVSSIIFGKQTLEERDENIKAFQNNVNKIIICMIQAGSESISLHDTDGGFPRVALISPSYSGLELVQALGRIYRTGVKSRVEQKIIFCDCKIERRMSEKISSKVKFLNNFADYDKLNPEDFSIK